MARKRLNEERSSLILQALRDRKTVGAIARELGHDRRTIERLAREHRLELPRRTVEVSEYVQREAAHLLEQTRVTMDSVARTFGLRKSTLKRRLSAAGIRGHGRHLRPAEQQRIEELRAEGRPAPDIARAIGRHSRTVERYLARSSAGGQACGADAPLAAAV